MAIFFSEGRKFHAIFSHEPNSSNELKLEVGDIVIGIERDLNGWMKGKKEKSGEIGMFPAIYAQECTQVNLEECEALYTTAFIYFTEPSPIWHILFYPYPLPSLNPNLNSTTS